MAIKTIPFQNTPSQFTLHILCVWLKRWGWLLLPPVALCLAFSLVRWEWLIVSLILILIIYPFVLSMIYYKYALHPDYRKFIHLITIEVLDDSLTIEYLEFSNKDTEPSEEKSFKSIRKEVINFNQIKSFSVTNKDLLISLHNPKFSYYKIKDDFWVKQEMVSLCPKNEAIDILQKNGIKFA